MPRKPAAQYYAVRLHRSIRNDIVGSDFAGFIDMLRHDGARVVSTLPKRESVWIVLEGTCTRERWLSFGIPVIGPYPSPADTSAAVAAHLNRLEEALG